MKNLPHPKIAAFCLALATACSLLTLYLMPYAIWLEHAWRLLCPGGSIGIRI